VILVFGRAETGGDSRVLLPLSFLTPAFESTYLLARHAPIMYGLQISCQSSIYILSESICLVKCFLQVAAVFVLLPFFYKFRACIRLCIGPRADYWATDCSRGVRLAGRRLDSSQCLPDGFERNKAGNFDVFAEDWLRAE
jgi:hypothetical protein